MRSCAAVSAAWRFLAARKGRVTFPRAADTVTIGRAVVAFQRFRVLGKNPTADHDIVAVDFYDNRGIPWIAIVFNSKDGKLRSIGPYIE